MKLPFLNYIYIFLLLFTLKSQSQETLPIYQDYLSDNVFLVHPSAAGIGNSSKLRFTARQQWAGIPNAPALQTLSFHTRFNEYSNAGYGFVLFNDKNGFHSQKGLQGTYAYHLPMSDGRLFNQLSFGLAFTFLQNQSDQRTFGEGTAQSIVSTTYYNADFSIAYHYGGLSSYFTAKNLLPTNENNLNVQQTLNLRNYVLYTGYYFGEDLFFQLEPSIMFQARQGTGARIADFNMKAYKTISKTQFWAALSYRRTFDANAIENAEFISPIIGVNYKNLLFSYTYTNQTNETVLTTSGFHQVSVGINLWTTKPRAAACPNINAAFGGF